MHELKIAQNIISIVEDELARRKITTPVNVIHFKAGRMHAIIPESLIFNFDSIKAKKSPFQNTTLNLEIIPLRLKCRQCQKTVELIEPVFECQSCKSTNLEILNGQEMFIDSFELIEE
jgi:hydrogenase nickel incorporation protein HypA/HybF